MIRKRMASDDDTVFITVRSLETIDESISGGEEEEEEREKEGIYLECPDRCGEGMAYATIAMCFALVLVLFLVLLHVIGEI